LVVKAAPIARLTRNLTTLISHASRHQMLLSTIIVVMLISEATPKRYILKVLIAHPMQAVRDATSAGADHTH
jgi:hypothetical protein